MSLPLAGFTLVVLAYGGHAAHLLQTGLLRRPAEPRAMLYLLALLATLGWGAAAGLDLGSAKRLAWHLALLFDQLRYIAWAVFMLALLRPQAGWLAPGRGLVALCTGLMLTSLGANLGLGIWPELASALQDFLLASQLAWAVLGLLLVEQVFRNQLEFSRWSAKPLCLGLACLFGFDLYLFSQALMFGGFDANALGARGLVHAAVLPLLLLAASRDVSWLARIQVSRTAVFYSASLLLIGAYLLFVSTAGYYIRFFGGSWGGALQVALLFIAGLLLTALMLSGALRAGLRVFLGKHFFRYRYDYRLEWLRFTEVLSTRCAPQEVGGLVVRALADLVECPAGALWLKDISDKSYVQSARWNMPQIAIGEPTDSTFCRQMRDDEWIIELDSTRPQSVDAALARPAWLTGLPSAWLVVPLLVADGMIGFVLLARPRAELSLNWEVRDLLKTAARQAAGFLAQMHATEALLEARKFDAFNRMSAFVVHDLKNIITQLSLMLKNAERHRGNAQFQQDMLETVESSLDKLRQMMLQLREGARPAGAAAGVELAPILQRIHQTTRLHGRQFELDITERVATRGHAQRLERVIGHVVQNALDATPASGTVSVRLAQSVGRAMVVVGDSGAGMSPEFIQQRLFRPFNSTKRSGMGIGSYESFQYIKELGGSIEVKSELGQGSVVTLLLPLFDLRTGSDLRAAT
ncbi:MAG: PEP-CTERM system histidine kinase PrsK [Betaproteobacteria bacterium]|nr:PEP-CTERM system histidine kinase PrsK [Betaproteobacteria bacterium]